MGWKLRIRSYICTRTIWAGLAPVARLPKKKKKKKEGSEAPIAWADPRLLIKTGRSQSDKRALLFVYLYLLFPFQVFACFFFWRPGGPRLCWLSYFQASQSCCN